MDMYGMHTHAFMNVTTSEQPLGLRVGVPGEVFRDVSENCLLVGWTKDLR
jgi:hypothetical protein